MKPSQAQIDQAAIHCARQTSYRPADADLRADVYALCVLVFGSDASDREHKALVKALVELGLLTKSGRGRWARWYYTRRAANYSMIADAIVECMRRKGAVELYVEELCFELELARLGLEGTDARYAVHRASQDPRITISPIAGRDRVTLTTAWGGRKIHHSDPLGSTIEGGELRKRRGNKQLRVAH